jgi:RNA polymerase sigma factor (sigma-70 family)
MDAAAPFQLGQLLTAPDSSSREAAWEELIERHTRLLLAIARSFEGGHDETMERYSYILEKLREDGFRRLRSFDENSGARFSTWLTVTSRRLCLDYLRSRYGRVRPRADGDTSDSLRSIRRALADYLRPELDIDLIADEESVSVITAAVMRERDRALSAALLQLQPRERLLIALRFQDDLSALRIARLLHAPTPFHIYRQLKAVLENLRSYLIARGIEGVDG